MVATAIPRVPLGGATTLRKYYVDVKPHDGDDTTWLGGFGIQENKPLPSDPQTQDSSDMDSGGYQSTTVTALAWSLELKLIRKTQAGTPTAYDPGQELIRTTALKMGVENLIDVRFYEMEPGGPRVEAFQGSAICQWSPEGGDMTALDTVTATLSGAGILNAIAHPFPIIVTP